MAKQDLIRVDGVIDETLPNTQFIVKLDNGQIGRASCRERV